MREIAQIFLILSNQQGWRNLPDVFFTASTKIILFLFVHSWTQEVFKLRVMLPLQEVWTMSPGGWMFFLLLSFRCIINPYILMWDPYTTGLWLSTLLPGFYTLNVNQDADPSIIPVTLS